MKFIVEPLWWWLGQGLLVVVLVALLFSLSDAQTCTYSILLVEGQVTAEAPPPCAELKHRIVGARLELEIGDQIVTVTLPSGWGLRKHTILYKSGDSEMLVDNYWIPVKVGGR